MAPRNLTTAAGLRGATRTIKRLTETVAATGHVLAHRAEVIRSAFQNPMTADLEEIGRFLPEKTDAFSRAGLSMVADFWQFQYAAAALALDFGSIAMSGRPPTMAEMMRLSSRSAQMGTYVSGAGAKALMPIHRTVTGNQRRLKRSAALRG